MQTDTSSRPTRGSSFVLHFGVWSVGLFGLLRLPLIEAAAVSPLLAAQGALAVRVFGMPPLPVATTLACSGADAIALCLAAVFAYPVGWWRRLAGGAIGLLVILFLNTLRIGTLGQASSSPAWFDALHLYIWPALLTLAIAGYVSGWMHVAGTAVSPAEGRPIRPSRRFLLLTAAFVLAFSAASPLYLESAGVLALAGFVAHMTAATLSVAGVSAHAAGNVLWLPRGGFAVTQECVVTPLIPIYLALVFAYGASWRWRLTAAAATVPLFTALAVARLLTVALPESIASPLFVVHAFYQILVGAVLVSAAAVWRHGPRRGVVHAALGIGAGAVFVVLLGPAYTRAIAAYAPSPSIDPQGAFALLPSFQVGLYVALSVAAFAAAGWTRVVCGLALLGLTQGAGLVLLEALARAAAFSPQVRDVRGWAIAAPVLIFMVVVKFGTARR